MPKKPRVRVRRTWRVRPGTLVIPDKTKRPFRKRKHKGRADENPPVSGI